MGTSQADKLDHHERIVGLAAQRLRQLGIDGVGVADLMKEVGLTHGGFYRHFDSREDLVAAALESALEQGSQRAANLASTARKSALNAIIDAHLSTTHRDAPGDGCAVTALAGDVGRGSARSRSAYTRHVRRYLDILGGAIKRRNGDAARRQAVLTLSAMVGAVAIARAVNDEELSREILAVTASALKP